MQQSIDGRKSRWVAHRERRRVQLIRAAVSAIVQSGPEVDMEQVARVAGVSKPVLYRYFVDKSQLWRAIGEHATQLVLEAVTPAISRVREERDLIAVTIDAYLGTIEGQPELYQVVMRHAAVPGVRHSIAGAAQSVASGLARVIGDRLRAVGLDSGPAEPWAVGMVGMVQAVGDWWMRHDRPMTRQALTDYLVTLLWQGVAGVRASADLPGGLGHADDGLAWAVPQPRDVP